MRTKTNPGAEAARSPFNLAAFCATRPGVALALAAVATACAILLIVARLGSPRSYFLDPALFADDPTAVLETFVVVEGRDRESVDDAISSIVAKLDAEPELFDVEPAGLDRAFPSLKRVANASESDAGEFRKLAALAAEARSGRGACLAVDAMLERLARDVRDIEPGALEDATAYLRALAVENGDPIRDGAESRFERARRNERVFSSEEQIGVVAVGLKSSAPSFEALERLDVILDSERIARPDATIGTTGPAVYEREARRLAARARLFVLVALALASIATSLLVVGRPRWVAAPFLVALVPALWTLGFVALVFARSSVATDLAFAFVFLWAFELSASYFARYATTRSVERSVSESTLATLREFAPRVARWTALLALLALVPLACGFQPCLDGARPDFSRASFFVELSATLFVGVLFAALSALAVAPSAFAFLDVRRSFRPIEPPLDLGAFLTQLARRPKFALLVFFLFAIVAGLGIRGARVEAILFDSSVVDDEARRLEELASAAFERGNWSAVSVSDSPDQAALRERALGSYPEIATRSLATANNWGSQDERAAVEALAQALAFDALDPPEVDPPTPERVAAAFERLASALKVADGPDEARRDARIALNSARVALAKETREGLLKRFRDVRLATVRGLNERFDNLRALVAPTFDERSDSVARRWTLDGKPLVRAYATAPIDSPNDLANFVDRALSPDPSARGFAPRVLADLNRFRSRARFALVVALVLLALGSLAATRSLRAVAPIVASPLLASALTLGLVLCFGPPTELAFLALALDAALTLAFAFAVASDLCAFGEPSRATSIAIASTSLACVGAFSGALFVQNAALAEFARAGALGVVVAAVVALTFVPSLDALGRPRLAPNDQTSQSDPDNSQGKNR